MKQAIWILGALMLTVSYASAQSIAKNIGKTSEYYVLKTVSTSDLPDGYFFVSPYVGISSVAQLQCEGNSPSLRIWTNYLKTPAQSIQTAPVVYSFESVDKCKTVENLMGTVSGLLEIIVDLENLKVAAIIQYNK